MLLSITINVLLTIHIIVSLLIILVTLMQRPKSEGLGAAFGGGMTENIFGAQTTNVLANFTRWMAGVFFVLTLTLSILYSKQSNQKSAIYEQLKNAPKPSATPAPAPPPVPAAPPAAKPAGSPAASPATSPASTTTATPAASPAPKPAATPTASPAAKPATEAPGSAPKPDAGSSKPQ
jgi:preprotein translocase subunit SecG